MTFLTKVYQMVEDPNTNHLIHWDSAGNGFLVTIPNKLASDIFPQYFKHTNFSSFTRLLHLYRFSKRPAGSPYYPNAVRFFNPKFIRGRVDLLSTIHRKINRVDDQRNIIRNLRQQLDELKEQNSELINTNRQLTNKLANTTQYSTNYQNQIPGANFYDSNEADFAPDLIFEEQPSQGTPFFEKVWSGLSRPLFNNNPFFQPGESTIGSGEWFDFDTPNRSSYEHNFYY